MKVLQVWLTGFGPSERNRGWSERWSLRQEAPFLCWPFHPIELLGKTRLQFISINPYTPMDQETHSKKQNSPKTKWWNFFPFQNKSTGGAAHRSLARPKYLATSAHAKEPWTQTQRQRGRLSTTNQLEIHVTEGEREKLPKTKTKETGSCWFSGLGIKRTYVCFSCSSNLRVEWRREVCWGEKPVHSEVPRWGWRISEMVVLVCARV